MLLSMFESKTEETSINLMITSKNDKNISIIDQQKNSHVAAGCLDEVGTGDRAECHLEGHHF